MMLNSVLVFFMLAGSFIPATEGIVLKTEMQSDTQRRIAVCPGESDRNSDHKCNHDETHRVCAELLGPLGTVLQWGSGSFWDITGQKDVQWDDQIRANNGNSWCICMWATATLIKTVGCDNVHLQCDATDVQYVMQKYTDGGVDLAPAKECLEKKCGFR